MTAIIVMFMPMGQEPNRIRSLRMAAGMSQEELAGLVGCSKMQISGLERGKPKLDLHWMQRISAQLGVAPADLLLPVDNPNAAQDEAERRLLGLFRQTPDELRGQLLNVSEAMAGYATASKKTAA